MPFYACYSHLSFSRCKGHLERRKTHKKSRPAEVIYDASYFMKMIFYECLHNQKPPITFVCSPYLLKAVPSFRRTIVDNVALPGLSWKDKNYLLKLNNGRLQINRD